MKQLNEDGAMEEPKYKLNVLMGHSEIRSWLEAEIMPDGQLKLVGMGSRTDFDRKGKVVAHSCEPTGCLTYWPAQDYRPAPWWRRIFNSL